MNEILFIIEVETWYFTREDEKTFVTDIFVFDETTRSLIPEPQYRVLNDKDIGSVTIETVEVVYGKLVKNSAIDFIEKTFPFLMEAIKKRYK